MTRRTCTSPHRRRDVRMTEHAHLPPRMFETASDLATSPYPPAPGGYRDYRGIDRAHRRAPTGLTKRSPMRCYRQCGPDTVQIQALLIFQIPCSATSGTTAPAPGATVMACAAPPGGTGAHHRDHQSLHTIRYDTDGA